MRRFSKKYYLQLFSEKPEIFGRIPENMLSVEQIEHLRQIPYLVIGDISGGNDPAYLLHTLAQKKPDAFVPTISYNGTEYGKWHEYGMVFSRIKTEAEKKHNIYVAEPVVLGAPQFWWALNERFADRLYRTYGINCRCLGCKTYNCALRVPLAKLINAREYIPSEAVCFLCTGSLMCLSPQIAGQLKKFLSGFGLELLLAGTGPGEQSFTGNNMNQGEFTDSSGQFMHCVLSGTCCPKKDGKGITGSIDDYFETFAIPAAAKVLSRTLAGLPVDYSKEAEETLRK